MSAAAATDATPPAKPKSKLMLIVAVVVVLALIGAGAAFFLLKKNAAEDEEYADEAPAAAQQSSKSKTPPTFLPMDNMVVNLADPGGSRFVQLGITLQLQDAKTGEDLKVYMPSIRSGVLLLISQRTTDEILQIQGKEQLATDIIAEISGVMGYEIDEPDTGTERKTKRRRAPPNPVQAVLFSSFIVQ